MDTSAYLERIGVAPPIPPTTEGLRQLQIAHLMSVPFENLDIGFGRAIVLDDAAFFEKVVRRRRGGFCYELNGLFAALLRPLGFRASLLSARVAKASGGFGPEYDHLTLLVEFPGMEPRRLADVGFGDSFLEPLRFDDPGEQPASNHDIGRAYQLRRAAEEVTLWRLEEDGIWKPQYLFSPVPRCLEEFAALCHYQQTSPESHFTTRRICSRATPTGRITLADLRLIVTENGVRSERALTDDQFQSVLQSEFGIDLRK